MKTYSLIILGFLNSFTNSAVPRFYNVRVPVAELCGRHKYVVKYENGTKRCSRCTRCRKGFQIQKECSTFEDTICEPCPSGSYNNVIGSDCKSCTACKPGQYVRRQCTAKRDTKCRKCPRGYFTLSGNVTACVPCKKCRRNEKIIDKCDGIKDTKCGECDDYHFRVSSTGSCLRCSKCPSSSQDMVVPECHDKIKNSLYTCWPQSDVVETYFSNSDSDIKETLLEVPIEDYILITDILPIILGLFLCVFIVLVLVFAIFRFTKCEHLIKQMIDTCSNSRADLDANNDTDSRVENNDECEREDDSITWDSDSLETNEWFIKHMTKEHCIETIR